MKWIRVLTGLAWVMMLGATAVWSNSPEAVLVIPDEVTVAGPKIRFSDLGRLTAGVNGEAEALGRIDLGQVPLPGQTRTFSRKYLYFILKQRPQIPVVRLEMSEQVTVRVASTGIKRTEIIAAVVRQLPEAPSGIVKQWVEVNELADTLWMPQGSYRIEAAPVGGLPRVGKALFKVKIASALNTRMLNMTVVIRQTGRMYRAKQGIKPFTLLQSGSFEQVEGELTTGREHTGGFPDNCRNTRLMQAGAFLNNEMLQPLPLVAEAAEVKVVVRGEGIEIAMVGIAQSDGWIGDLITIINPSSKKRFQGRVTGVGRAEVMAE